MVYENTIKSTDEPTIVGILLVRNEDLFIKRVILNIIHFCDQIIVADNKSKDKTGSIVKSLAERFPKIQYHYIDHPSKSHDLIKGFANKPVWIFAVDGDEIYDPIGLAILRTKILNREYSDVWMLFGNVLNCINLNQENSTATGYISPPCRSMTKLYNFNLIEKWAGECPERLHGGEIAFKDEMSSGVRLLLHEKMIWEESFFRCLHICFIRRSSRDKSRGDDLYFRQNISDKNSTGIMQRAFKGVASLLGMKKTSSWKDEKYSRGPLVKKDVCPFFSDHGATFKKVDLISGDET